MLSSAKKEIGQLLEQLMQQQTTAELKQLHTVANRPAKFNLLTKSSVLNSLQIFIPYSICCIDSCKVFHSALLHTQKSQAVLSVVYALMEV